MFLVQFGITHTWRGFSTAIFLELGNLTNADIDRNQKGEATCILQFDWRVEKKYSIYFGSGSGNRKIANGLKKLIGEKIINVEIEGRLPELIISLSSNLWLRTFSIYESQPQWTIFLPNGNCLFSKAGKINIEKCNKN